MSALDDILPAYRFRERHEKMVAATPEKVWSALLTVNAQDLPLSRVLMGMRGLPSLIAGRTKRFNRASRTPVIDLFIRSGFCMLRSDPPHVLVAGGAIQPWRLAWGEVGDVHDLPGFRAFNQAGFVVTAISFELQEAGAGTRLSTETRVQPTDARAGRAFLPYWLVIRAGSGLIRREMLGAVARRCWLSPGRVHRRSPFGLVRSC